MSEKRTKDPNAQALGRKRWQGISADERSRLMSEAVQKRHAQEDSIARVKSARHASRAYWDALTPEERSAEMKRRAAKRRKGKS